MSPTTVIEPLSERRRACAAASARGPGPRRRRCGRRCGSRRRHRRACRLGGAEQGRASSSSGTSSVVQATLVEGRRAGRCSALASLVVGERPAGQVEQGCEPNRSWSSSAGVSTGHIRSSASRTSGRVEPLAHLPGSTGRGRCRPAPRTPRLHEAAAGVVASGSGAGVGRRCRALRSTSTSAASAPVAHPQVLAQRPLAVAHRPGQHPAMRRSPFTRAASPASTPGAGASVDEVGEHRQLDPGLAERGQHLLDVAEEEPVGADHEHALALEREPVGVEQVGGPVQRHHRLAGAGAALDDEHPGQRGPDDLVLLALDGGDDVAEAPGAGLSSAAMSAPRARRRELAAPVRPRRAEGSAARLAEQLVLDAEQVRPRVAKWRRRTEPQRGCGPVAR
jgi:hypothetical protein